MENKKQSMGKTALIVVLLLVTIVSLVLATYAWAKYTTTETGTATAQVAKWDVGLTADDTKFVGTYSHVLAQRIAPGTSGSFEVSIDPKSTEVDFDYSIIISGVENKPTNLHFYTDAAFTDEISVEGVSNTNLTGRVTLGTATAVTETIYWNWAYETTTAATEIPENAAMIAEMTKLATLKGATAEELAAATTATTLADLAKTKGATDADINNVIDTVEGQQATADNAMKVNYTLTAVQVNPAE